MKEKYERMSELDRKIDEGISTREEEEERYDLWVEISNEEESDMLNTCQFGY